MRWEARVPHLQGPSSSEKRREREDFSSRAGPSGESEAAGRPRSVHGCEMKPAGSRPTLFRESLPADSEVGYIRPLFAGRGVPPGKRKQAAERKTRGAR